MPSCINCQTPYEEGQRFCKACGAPLINSAPQPVVCRQCGETLSPGQPFCHGCGASAAAASEPAGPAPSGWRRPPGFVDRVMHGSPAHILALAGGCLVFLVVILLGINWLGGSGTRPAPPALPGQAGPSPPAAGPQALGKDAAEVLGPPFFRKPTKAGDIASAQDTSPPPAPEPALSLQEEMEEVLFNFRKGQMDKNIDLFMSCFASSFPDLDGKRQSTLKRWQDFDFIAMVFHVEDVQEVAADSHIALVKWDIQARNQHTHQVASSSQKYKVWFIKEHARRLIKSFEKEGKEENG